MTVSGDGWRVLGASICGVSHVQLGETCQDAHGWQELAGGTLVAAVADGAGSAPLAAIGASRAVQAALSGTAAQLASTTPTSAESWEALLRQVFRGTRQALEIAAAARGVRLEDLATTLLLACVAPSTIAAAQVGDGAIVARVGDDLLPITRPPVNEYCNETTFLTGSAALDLLQVAVQSSSATGLAMFTDGLQMLALKMPQGDPHRPFFAPLLRFTATMDDPERAQGQLRDFLRSPRVSERANDDLTLVLAVRTSASVEGRGDPIVEEAPAAPETTPSG